MTRSTAVRAGVLAAFAVAALAPAGPASAAVPGHYAGTFFYSQLCRNAGDAGIQSGQWDSYVCQLQTDRKDPYWKLYVTP